MNANASWMVGSGGERVALTEVSIRAQLQDLLAQVDVSQSYRNDEALNIEAVYTFSLPLDAVLLDLEVQLGERILRGEVTAKFEAQERYEAAIENGDGAVMLEQIEPGLYTMSVGNLAAGETAVVRFTYSLLYRWSGSQFRFQIPTTIAPRYGVSPHQPYQAPQHSLSVENTFELELEVFGALRDAKFLDPSFACAYTRESDRALLKLNAKKAVMDRDFVVTVESKEAERSFALCDQDIEGMAAIASFQPFFPGLRESKSLRLIAIVDCSGSMGGDSIGQAKKALAHLLSQVGPQDQVTVIAFGSTTKTVSETLLNCTPGNVRKLKTFCEELDSDLGGTEIESALKLGYQIAAKAPASDLFLITDGEVSDWEPVTKAAGASGHRIFTVGVGNAVAEAFVRGLATETGGACELVMPTEEMSARIVRHFERLRAPRAKRVRIQWPEGATECTSAQLSAVFDGDSVTASARLPALSGPAEVVLELETEAGSVSRQALELKRSELRGVDIGVSTIARLAAASRLREATEYGERSIALKYQLLSRYTNWIVIAERSAQDRLSGTPALRIVPQTLAAGWGGTGSTGSSGSVNQRASGPELIIGRIPTPAVVQRSGPSAGMRFGVDSYSASLPAASSASPTLWRDPSTAASQRAAGADKANASFDVAAFLSGDVDGSSRPDSTGKGASGSPATRRPQFDPDSKIGKLIRLIDGDPSWLDESRSMELLRASGFEDLIDEISGLIDDAPLSRKLVLEMLLGMVLSDQVIAALPANLQSRARSLHHHGLQIIQVSLLTSTQAAKAFEFLIRSEPYDLLEPINLVDPIIVDQARAALAPIAKLTRIIEAAEALAKRRAQEALHEGLVNSPA